MNQRESYIWPSWLKVISRMSLEEVLNEPGTSCADKSDEIKSLDGCSHRKKNLYVSMHGLFVSCILMAAGL